MVGQKTLIVLPGSGFQTPLLAKAKAMGHRVISIDIDPDCECAPLADHFLPISLNDIDGIIEAVRPFNPDGVVTDQSDRGVTVAAAIADAFGLPGLSTEMARLFTDKSQMRKFLQTSEFPSPEFRLLGPHDDPADAASEIGFPLVVKPLASQSSKGVTAVSDIGSLGRALKFARENSVTKSVVVETYLGGQDFSVEGFADSDGHHTTLAIGLKYQFDHAPMVIQSIEYGPDNADFDFVGLKAQHDDLIRRTGVRNAMTHSEYKFVDGRFVLIEFAARGGGSGIASHIVPFISGVDYQALTIKAALGETVRVNGLTPEPRWACLEFLNWPAGRLDSLAGLDRIREFRGVVVVDIKPKIGEAISPIQDGTTRPVRLILTADSEKELTELRSYVAATLTPSISALEPDGVMA